MKCNPGRVAVVSSPVRFAAHSRRSERSRAPKGDRVPSESIPMTTHHGERLACLACRSSDWFRRASVLVVPCRQGVPLSLCSCSQTARPSWWRRRSLVTFVGAAPLPSHGATTANSSRSPHLRFSLVAVDLPSDLLEARVAEPDGVPPVRVGWNFHSFGPTSSWVSQADYRPPKHGSADLAYRHRFRQHLRP